MGRSAPGAETRTLANNVLTCGHLFHYSPVQSGVRVMPFMFEKLEVYQKAVDFADQIAALTEGFPRGYGFLTDQLNRAALSIAANLAEGNGRFTKPDRKHFFTGVRAGVRTAAGGRAHGAALFSGRCSGCA